MSVAALKERVVSKDDNLPPLAEQLHMETEDLRKRAEDLIAGAERAAVIDEETAGKATALVAMITAHGKAVETAFKDRKRPVLDAAKAIDTHFGSITDRLKDAKARALKLIDDFRRKKEAEAAAERARLAEEARKAEETARKAREEAAAKITEAEQQGALAAARARADAKKLEDEALDAEIAAQLHHQQAEQVQDTTIRSDYGNKAFAKKEWLHQITDLGAAIKHARKVDEAAVTAAIDQIVKRQVRAGVRAFPGVEITETTTTQVR